MRKALTAIELLVVIWVVMIVAVLTMPDGWWPLSRHQPAQVMVPVDPNKLYSGQNLFIKSPTNYWNGHQAMVLLVDKSRGGPPYFVTVRILTYFGPPNREIEVLSSELVDQVTQVETPHGK